MLDITWLEIIVCLTNVHYKASSKTPANRPANNFTHVTSTSHWTDWTESWMVNLKLWNWNWNLIGQQNRCWGWALMLKYINCITTPVSFRTQTYSGWKNSSLYNLSSLWVPVKIQYSLSKQYFLLCSCTHIISWSNF